VTREDADKFAYESQRKAATAREQGKFKAEIVPVTTKYFDEEGNAKEVTVSDDTILRPETTVEGLAKLRPAFNAKGVVTAGNASPLTDGAAAAVVMSEEKAKELGVKPLGYFIDFQVAGVPPEIMGVGPVPAVKKLLAKNKLKVEDIDVFELNEAFAAQALHCIRELGIPQEKVNPNGGAIALGHPLGVSGTRLVATILQELKRRNGRYGVVTMCIGGSEESTPYPEDSSSRIISARVHSRGRNGDPTGRSRESNPASAKSASARSEGPRTTRRLIDVNTTPPASRAKRRTNEPRPEPQWQPRWGRPPSTHRLSVGTGCRRRAK
jgi:hypothetical protein